MLTKRDFIKGTAAVVVATAVVTPGSSTVVVYDERHSEARAFAEEFGGHALKVQGDAGRLWYDTLRGLGARQIAGMTTHTDLLILRTLAREQGLKVCRSHRGSNTRLVSWVLT
jgi:hypothetical protein